MKLFLAKCTAILFLAGCSSLEVLKTNFEARMLSNTENIYIVKSGDSIWSIALKYNLDPQTIIDRNNFSKPFRIFPGEKLFLSKNIFFLTYFIHILSSNSKMSSNLFL